VVVAQLTLVAVEWVLRAIQVQQVLRVVLVW
jgi:hypothetical protein